ncbi:MAG: VanZ family protein [Campylobacterota bacterium]|nr:VanZ family protein [Campylobacterota bacterium]
MKATFYKLLENEKLFQILFFICLVSIEFLATTTMQIKVVESMWDKSNHFIAFLTLYLLISLGFRKLSLVKKVLWLLLFAVQIEVVQHFIEGRFFSLLDVVADLIGVVIGIVTFKILRAVSS